MEKCDMANRRRSIEQVRDIYQVFTFFFFVYFKLSLFREISGILIAAKEGKNWLFKYFVCFFYICLEIEKTKAREFSRILPFFFFFDRQLFKCACQFDKHTYQLNLLEDVPTKNSS